jgi:hypothetical protein
VKTIVDRVLNEPAVAIGFAFTVALGAVNAGDAWTAQTIFEVFAPLATALGIRPYVTPTSRD